jgi:dynein heavy chain, axonemal
MSECASLYAGASYDPGTPPPPFFLLYSIIENRVEQNLKIVSKTMLVDLPSDRSYTLDEFVALQETSTSQLGSVLQGKNIEVENAVSDLVTVITGHVLDRHIERVSVDDVARIRSHYNHFLYSALLNATKASLNALKKRVSSVSMARMLASATGHADPARPASVLATGGSSKSHSQAAAVSSSTPAAAPSSTPAQRPLFEVDLKLQNQQVRLSPSLDDVQHSINRCAKAILSVSRSVWDWGQQGLPEEQRRSFFDLITRDIEVVRVVLLLTGSLQSLRLRASAYLTNFDRFSWLWEQDIDATYQKFLETKPATDDYEREILRFGEVEEEIGATPDSYALGALSLCTTALKTQLQQSAVEWRNKYADNLHRVARTAMSDLTEYIKQSSAALARPVDSLASLRFAMETMKAIRQKESQIEGEVVPLMEMYATLEVHLQPGQLTKEEMDQKSVLRSSWRKLLDKAEEVNNVINRLQSGFKKRLITDLKVRQRQLGRGVLVVVWVGPAGGRWQVALPMTSFVSPLCPRPSRSLSSRCRASAPSTSPRAPWPRASHLRTPWSA